MVSISIGGSSKSSGGGGSSSFLKKKKKKKKKTGLTGIDKAGITDPSKIQRVQEKQDRLNKANTKPETKTIDQSKQQGRLGAKPEFRTTIQGDRFDVNKPLLSNAFRSRESFIQAQRIRDTQARTGQATGGFLDTGQVATPLNLSQREQAQKEQEAAQNKSRNIPLTATSDLVQAQAQGQEGEKKTLGQKFTNIFNKVLPQQTQAVASTSVLDTISKKEGNIEGIRNLTEYMHTNNLAPEEVSSDPAVIAALRLDLNDMDLEVLKKQDAKISKTGQFIEAIPGVGGQVAKWAHLATTPSQQVEDTLKEIKEIDSQIMENRRFASRSNDPVVKQSHLNRVEAKELRLLQLESKIKLISIQSPELQAAPEEVDGMMQIIEGVKGNIIGAKEDILSG